MSGACSGLVSPRVEGMARSRSAELISIALASPFILAAGAIPVASSLTGPGPLLAILSALLASFWTIAVLVGVTGLNMLGERALLYLGIASVATLTALAGGLASPLSLLAIALALEIRRLDPAGGTRRGLFAGLAALAAAQVLAMTSLPGGSPNAWHWMAPALYLMTLLGRQGRGPERETVGAPDSEPDFGLLRLQLQADGAVLEIKGRTEEQLGLAPELLCGMGLFERLRVSDRVGYRCAVSQAAGTDEAQALEISVRLPAEGGAAYRLFRLRLQRKAGLGTIDALMEPLDELAKLRSDLVTARETVAETEIAKSRFLAAVSHELRTPLNAIIGFSDVLAHEEISGPMEARQREHVGHIRDAGHHLLDVVNAILDVTKIESGTYQIARERFETAAALSRARAMLGEQAALKGVALDVKVDPAAGRLFADQRAVQQMLINLLSNAIKFTPAGGKVELAARRRGGLVELAVSDTGIGIAPADLSRLGQPFAQVHNDYTRQFEGTGLGLSLVKGLVELHKGSMTIESEPGVGTVVTLGLPFEEESELPRAAGDGEDETPRKIA